MTMVTLNNNYEMPRDEFVRIATALNEIQESNNRALEELARKILCPEDLHKIESSAEYSLREYNLLNEDGTIPVDVKEIIENSVNRPAGFGVSFITCTCNEMPRTMYHRKVFHYTLQPMQPAPEEDICRIS